MATQTDEWWMCNLPIKQALGPKNLHIKGRGEKDVTRAQVSNRGNFPPKTVRCATSKTGETQTTRTNENALK